MHKMKNSGVEWVSQIPRTWDIVPLKSVFSFGKGLSITKADLIEEGIPVLSYGQIHSKANSKTAITDTLLRFVPANTVSGCKESLTTRNGFVFADTSEDLAGCGNCNYVDRDGVYAGYHTVNLRPKNEEDWRYLAYLFQTDAWRYQLRKELTEVKLYSISQKALKKTSILVPPESERKCIAAFLDNQCAKIDEAISRHRAIIEKLEKYRRATIADGVSGRLFNDTVKATSIPWMPSVPLNWDVVPLWTMFKERKNKNVDGVERNLLSLSYGRIKRKNIDTSEGLLPANFNGYNIIEAGDIVLRLTDLQNDMRSLRTGLVKEKGIITSAYVTLEPIVPLNSSYYHYLLHSYDIMKVFYSMGEGVRQNLNFDELSRMLIPVPPLEEQMHIASYLDEKTLKIDEAVSRQEGIIAKMQDFRKSLIYHAVTGKIDCRKEVSHEIG